MAAKLLRGSNLLALALVGCALMVQASLGQESNESKIRSPLEPLVIKQSESPERKPTVSRSSGEPSDQGLLGSDLSASPSSVSSITIKRTTSEFRNFSDPNQKPKITCSRSVHITRSSGNGEHKEHSFVESSDDDDDDDSSGKEEDENDHDVRHAATAASARSFARSSGRNSEGEELPTIIDESVGEHRLGDWNEYGPESELENMEFESSNNDEITYGPELRQKHDHGYETQSRPTEHVDETYIDDSDPNDPKKVHYHKEVKAQVVPNGESYQENESKTSHSIGANPNSYSQSHSSSSSSSSYVTSHSGSGGGNYKHYEHGKNSPSYRPFNSNGNNYINDNYRRPDEVKPLPPLPPIPGFLNIPTFPRFPPVPRVPHAPAMPAAWLDLAMPSPSIRPLGSYGPSVQSRGSGHLIYVPSSDNPKRLHFRMKRNKDGRSKRQMVAMRLAEKLDRSEHDRHNNHKSDH